MAFSKRNNEISTSTSGEGVEHNTFSYLTFDLNEEASAIWVTHLYLEQKVNINLEIIWELKNHLTRVILKILTQTSRETRQIISQNF